MNYSNHILSIHTLSYRNFISLIFSIQLLIIGLIILESIGIKLPILRQLFGFIYLTFIPGILIIKIFKLDELNLIETLIYSCGLSLSIIMIMGLVMNLIFPLFGISNPLFLFYLLTTISSLVFLLIITYYFKSRNETKCFYKSLDLHVPTIQALILFLIPFFSILGAYLVNYYNNHILMFVLIIVLSILPIYVIFSKRVNEDYYPLIIFISSISILLHWSLITMYISGGDIHYEYYYANLVNVSDYWISTIPHNLNAMLSVVILAPVYSKILNLNLVWVFKLVYPSLYALVPIGLYQIFKKQTNSKVAFLAVSYFMFVFPFFSEMLQLARQEIAEIFLVLLLMIITGTKMDSVIKSSFFILFGFSLIVSHYGVSYILLIVFIAYIIIYLLLSYLERKKFSLISKISKNRINLLNNIKPLNLGYRNLSLSYVILFFCIIFVWYTYVSNSTPFNSIIQIGNQITDTIISDFFESKDLQAVSMVLYDYGRFHAITKYLYLGSQMAILLGIITLFFKPRIMNLTKDYKILSLAFAMFLGLSIILPNFASSINTTRLFHIVLFVLAPFSIIGTITGFKILGILTKKKRFFNKKNAMNFFAIFLMAFLLFTSGFIYEIGNDEPISIALSNNYDFPKFTEQEIDGALWVKNNSHNIIASDTYGIYLLSGYFPSNKTVKLTRSKNYQIIYLRAITVREDKLTIMVRNGTIAQPQEYDLENFVINLNKLYSNGESDVYGK